MTEEPSYIAFARANVRALEHSSPTLVRSLIERIDRDAAKTTNYPDRDELAYALFAADNHNMKPEQIPDDFYRTKARQEGSGYPFYVYTLADAALEMFRKANQ